MVNERGLPDANNLPRIDQTRIPDPGVERQQMRNASTVVAGDFTKRIPILYGVVGGFSRQINNLSRVDQTGIVEVGIGSQQI